MARKKPSPEERARWAAQRAEWDRQRDEFESIFARWRARMDAAEEREQLRQQRLRRLTLGLLGR
jgi:hypothetical protein